MNVTIESIPAAKRISRQVSERDSAICQHNSTSTTRELGPHCCDCGEPLVGMFWAISRNTPAGALLYAMRNNTSGSQKHGQ